MKRDESFDKYVFLFSKQNSEDKRTIRRVFEQENIFLYENKGVKKSIFGLIALSIWFPLYYYLIYISVAKIYKYFFIGVTIIISVSIFRLITYLLKWKKNEIKHYYAITPLFILISDFDKITVYNLSTLSDVKGIHKYTNGVYNGTDVTLKFNSETKVLDFNHREKCEEFIKCLESTRENLYCKATKGEKSFFEKNNFLKTISPVSKMDSDKNLGYILLHLIPILFAILTYLIFTWQISFNFHSD